MAICLFVRGFAGINVTIEYDLGITSSHIQKQNLTSLYDRAFKSATKRVV